MSLSLFHRPGTVVFLDDDPGYLDMLGLVLPHHWHIKLFVRAQDCLDYLQQEPPFWEADAWTQQQMVDQWREGKALIPQLLSYWSKSTERYALSRICVVDFSMPAMNGLEVLGELVEWPGARVLLTGQADEQAAVKAFNAGLIDQFVAKQAPAISHRLIQVVDRLMAIGNPRQDQTWRATFKPEQYALLLQAPIAKEIGELVKRWVEYVVIGDPFGILGLDGTGRVEWLQLEPATTLADLAELAETEGVPAAAMADIRRGQRLVDLQLRQALGRTAPPQLAPAFPIGPEGKLYGALFTVDRSHCPDPANSYNQWLARQDKRHVQN